MATTAATLLILVAISLNANSRLRAHSHLPMQFGLTGAVGWSAPRLVALSFSPVLTALIMLPMTLFPDAADTLPLVGIAMIGGHVLHLWLIARHLRS